jgi:hypothetical protein
MMTIALPTYNSNSILWLQLEALCNQATSHDWELIVCEEVGAYYSGEKYLEPYLDRLKEAGCKRVKYIRLTSWVPLSQKWVIIAEEARFENYALCASDNYSPSDRIERSVEALNDADWVDWSRGLFVDLNTFKTARWERPRETATGLFMATKTKFMQSLEGPYPKRNIDGWIRDQSPIKKRVNISKMPNGLHTDGANQISHHRAGLYNGKKYLRTFHKDPHELRDLVPQYIVEQLQNRFG